MMNQRLHLSQKRVKFFCRSFNKELYLNSRRLYEDAGYPCVRLTDQTADGYFFTMLADTDCDVAINVDEDAFLYDVEAVLNLADLVVARGVANAGCSDAAAGCLRGGNPIITNPFFNIFNLELIRTKWDIKQGPIMLRTFDYAEVRTALEEKFEATEHHTLHPKARTELMDYEPYCAFFFWLALNFETMYLDTRRHADDVSVVALSPEGTPLCVHTWFARFYHPSWLSYLFEGNSVNLKHSQRIDDIIDEVYAMRCMERIHPSVMELLSYKLDTCQRWCVKIPQRVGNWPNKLRKRMSKK